MKVNLKWYSSNLSLGKCAMTCSSGLAFSLRHFKQFLIVPFTRLLSSNDPKHSSQLKQRVLPSTMSSTLVIVAISKQLAEMMALWQNHLSECFSSQDSATASCNRLATRKTPSSNTGLRLARLFDFLTSLFIFNPLTSSGKHSFWTLGCLIKFI